MARLLSMCHVPADVAPGMPGSGVPAPACLGLNNARHSQATCLGDMAVVGGHWKLGTTQPLLILMTIWR